MYPTSEDPFSGGGKPGGGHTSWIVVMRETFIIPLFLFGSFLEAGNNCISRIQTENYKGSEILVPGYNAPSPLTKPVWFPNCLRGKYLTISKGNEDSLPIPPSQHIFEESVTFGIRSDPYTSKDHPVMIRGGNTKMGFLVSSSHMLFLDGLASSRTIILLESLLDFMHSIPEEEYNVNVGGIKRNIPVIKEGLVIALVGKDQLLLLTFGNPPLGVVVLREESKDNENTTFQKVCSNQASQRISCKIQTKDLIIVGDSEGVSELQVNPSHSLDTIALDSLPNNYGLVVVSRIMPPSEKSLRSSLFRKTFFTPKTIDPSSIVTESWLKSPVLWSKEQEESEKWYFGGDPHIHNGASPVKKVEPKIVREVWPDSITGKDSVQEANNQVSLKPKDSLKTNPIDESMPEDDHVINVNPIDGGQERKLAQISISNLEIMVKDKEPLNPLNNLVEADGESGLNVIKEPVDSELLNPDWFDSLTFDPQFRSLHFTSTESRLGKLSFNDGIFYGPEGRDGNYQADLTMERVGVVAQADRLLFLDGLSYPEDPHLKIRAIHAELSFYTILDSDIVLKALPINRDGLVLVLDDHFGLLIRTIGLPPLMVTVFRPKYDLYDSINIKFSKEDEGHFVLVKVGDIILTSHLDTLSHDDKFRFSPGVTFYEIAKTAFERTRKGFALVVQIN